VDRHAYNEQLDRRHSRRRADTTSTRVKETTSDRGLVRSDNQQPPLLWPRAANTDVEDTSRWTSKDSRRRHVRQSAASDPASHQKTRRVHQHVSHVDQPSITAAISVRDGYSSELCQATDDHGVMESELAAAESRRYAGSCPSETTSDDVGQSRSDMVDVRARRTSTKTGPRSERTRQKPCFTQRQYDDDLTTGRDEWYDDGVRGTAVYGTCDLHRSMPRQPANTDAPRRLLVRSVSLSPSLRT